MRACAVSSGKHSPRRRADGAPAQVYAFFGITLALSPRDFWGPESPFCYWSAMDASGQWFGRACGIFMAAVTLSPWTAGADKTVLAKTYLLPNIVYTILFIQAGFFMDVTGPGPNALVPGLNLWHPQIAIGLALTYLNVAALQESKAKAK